MGKALTITGGSTSDNDIFSVTEDQVAAGTLIFNVLANDPNKVVLYSLDNGQAADLLTQDQAGAAERSSLGNSIRITSDGRIAYGQGLDASVVQSLAAGESITDTFVYAYKQGGSSLIWQTVRVTITGTNDAPVARADTGLGIEGTVTTGSVASNDSDVDHGAMPSFAVTGQPLAGFSMADNGTWTFDGSNAAYNSLRDGEQTTRLVTYSVTDEHGASSSSSLTLTIIGTNDAPVVINSFVDEAFAEDGGSMAGTVVFSDADLGEAHSASVAPVSGGNPFGTFVLGSVEPYDPADTSYVSWHYELSDPNVLQFLNEGEQVSEQYRVTITDANGAPVTQLITVNFRGSNDAPVAAAASASVGEDGSLTGQLTATDADHGAVLTYSLTGDAPAGFALAADGSWTFDASNAAYQSLGEGDVQTINVGFAVADEYGERSNSTLTLMLSGANDAPTTTSQWIEVAENLSAAGNLFAYDQDNSAHLTFAVDGQAPDGFVLTANGAWSFDGTNGAYDHLTDGEVQLIQVPFTVTDEYGASTASFIMVSVTGRNDVATIGGVQSGSVTEAALGNAGTPSAQGQLTIADPDSPAEFQPVSSPAASLGGYGSFTLTAAGEWAYQLNNGNGAVESLGTGQTLQDYFTVQSADGSSSVVTITINGRTDYAPPPVSTAADPNDFDALSESSAVAGPVNYVGTSSNNSAHGSQLGDTMVGLPGSDNFYGHGGDDLLWGDFQDPATAGANFYIDRLYGQAGNDTLYGGLGGDTLYGGSGDDTLYANGSNGLDAERNYLYGGSGNDRIFGSVGGDEIRGGTGADTITGGGGADRFMYSAFNETGDTITDYTSGFDAFDFTALGPNYRFVGQVSSPLQLQPGQVGYVVSNGDTILYLDGYGTEKGVDMEITLLGVTGLSGTDVWFG